MARTSASITSAAARLVLLCGSMCFAAPTVPCIANSSCGPVPGLSSTFSNYQSVQAPWPGNTTGAVLNTTVGPPGSDDLLFQNLLAAEWIVFSFYQQGVERFNSSAFRAAGFSYDTYDRIREIRNNEAGHLRIFQNQISSSSVKPGPCKYEFPFETPYQYLALQTLIEVSSMTFLTGLELQAKTNASKGALVAIASTETRHEAWALMSNWHTKPFDGPSDTYFPYANQVLQVTAQWVINGSCPKENPIFPSPKQNLLTLSINSNQTTGIVPGSRLGLGVSRNGESASLKPGQDYYAVFFHGVLNMTMPLNTTDLTTTVPQEIEPTGIIAVVIATMEGAPTEDSVVAGPVMLLQQPAGIEGNIY